MSNRVDSPVEKCEGCNEPIIINQIVGFLVNAFIVSGLIVPLALNCTYIDMIF